MIFYFSATGNSRWVAMTLAEKFHTDVYKITASSGYPRMFHLKENESVGFVFPVHAWGPPENLLSFITSLRFSSDPSFLYFVCTCGDDAGKTADVFCRFLYKQGWKCASGYSVIMPNTYVCLPGFDVDPLAVEQRKREKAREETERLAERIREKRNEFCCHEGSFPRLKTYVLRPLFKKFLMSPSKFHVTDACISCGVCENTCPLQNIHLTDGKPHWDDHCVMCLACYHHCPKHAIAYGRQTAKKGQYLFKKP